MQRELQEMADTFDWADYDDNSGVPRPIDPVVADQTQRNEPSRCEVVASWQVWLRAPDLGANPTQPAARTAAQGPSRRRNRNRRGERPWRLWASRTFFSATGLGLVMLLHFALSGRDPAETPLDKPWPDRSVREATEPNGQAAIPRVAEQTDAHLLDVADRPAGHGPEATAPVYRTSRANIDRTQPAAPHREEAAPSGTARLHGGIEHLPN